MFNKLIAVVFLVLLGACTGLTPNDEERHVAHVVLVWLKEPGNTEQRQQVIEATQKLSVIEGVVRVEAGQTVPSDRDVVDDSFDVGLYFELSSRQALRSYAQDPLHIKILREEIAPVTDHYVVYDFEVNR